LTKELSLVEHADLLDKVGRAWIEKRNPTTVAKELGIPRKEVLVMIEEFRDVAKNSQELQDRAIDALHEYDATLNRVIEEAWSLHKRADDQKIEATMLKTIADVERQRVETLQKAGLYSDSAIGDELAAMEEKAQAIKELLKAVASQHPEARLMIQQGLTKIFGQPEGVDIVEGERARR
jgi:hypothetical protein